MSVVGKMERLTSIPRENLLSVFNLVEKVKVRQLKSPVRYLRLISQINSQVFPLRAHTLALRRHQQKWNKMHYI